MAEKYYSVSPYCYCHNNPLNCIDLFGAEDQNSKIYWQQVAKGMSSMFGGLASMAICFTAAAEAPVASKAGLVSFGKTSLGTATLGLANVVAGLSIIHKGKADVQPQIDNTRVKNYDVYDKYHEIQD